jgi:hypothetical protein
MCEHKGLCNHSTWGCMGVVARFGPGPRETVRDLGLGSLPRWSGPASSLCSARHGHKGSLGKPCGNGGASLACMLYQDLDFVLPQIFPLLLCCHYSIALLHLIPAALSILPPLRAWPCGWSAVWCKGCWQQWLLPALAGTWNAVKAHPRAGCL